MVVTQAKREEVRTRMLGYSCPAPSVDYAAAPVVDTHAAKPRRSSKRSEAGWSGIREPDSALAHCVRSSYAGRDEEVVCGSIVGGCGAGYENRTRVSSLGSSRTTTVLIPHGMGGNIRFSSHEPTFPERCRSSMEPASPALCDEIVRTVILRAQHTHSSLITKEGSALHQRCFLRRIAKPFADGAPAYILRASAGGQLAPCCFLSIVRFSSRGCSSVGLERRLAKAKVAGSSPVIRSSCFISP